MADVISHNIDQVIKGLTAFQRVKLPRAARRTVNRLGYVLAKKDIPVYMQGVFENPTAFTRRGLEYKVVSNYEVHIKHRQNVGKGNDPARYLEPVAKTGGVGRKPAYQTKFTRYIHKSGIAPRNLYPVPFEPNLKKNSYGKVSQGEYSKAWRGLQTTKGAGKTGRGFRYFSKPDNRGRSRVSNRQGSFFDLPDGIYRVKGRGNGGVQLLFTYARKQPTVPQIYDYVGFSRKHVAAFVPRELARHLK